MVTNARLGVVKIKKRTPQEWMILAFFFLPFMLAFLTELIGVPSFVRYFLDVVLIFLAFLALVKRSIVFPSKAKPFVVFIILFFVYAVAGYLLHFESPFYFLWGTRNTFRFYLAFVVFVNYVTQDEAENWLRYLDVLFWINFFVSIIQFFTMNIHQDKLGGIFGTTSASNGYTLLFMCIVIGRALLMAFDDKESYIYCALKCIASF